MCISQVFLLFGPRCLPAPKPQICHKVLVCHQLLQLTLACGMAAQQPGIHSSPGQLPPGLALSSLLPHQTARSLEALHACLSTVSQSLGAGVRARVSSSVMGRGSNAPVPLNEPYEKLMLTLGADLGPEWPCARPYGLGTPSIATLSSTGPSWVVIRPGSRQNFRRKSAYAQVRGCSQSWGIAVVSYSPTNA